MEEKGPSTNNCLHSYKTAHEAADCLCYKVLDIHTFMAV